MTAVLRRTGAAARDRGGEGALPGRGRRRRRGDRPLHRRGRLRARSASTTRSCEPVVDPVARHGPTARRACTRPSTSNVVFHRSLDFGDVEGDLARAHTVVRRTRALAPDGRPARSRPPARSARSIPTPRTMTVWSNTNFYNFLPWSFAGMLGVPNNRLRMIPCAVGGSFGSKHLINKVINIAGRADQGHRPARASSSRTGSTTSRPTTTSGAIASTTPQLALSADGEMLGLTLKIIDDYGAYFQFAHGQHGNAMSQPTGPYRIGSVRYDVACVLTNKVQQGFFRGAGADPGQLHPGTARRRGRRGARASTGPSCGAATSSQPDQFPYTIPTGNVYDSGDYAAVLDRALEIADLPHWRAEQERLRAGGPLPRHRAGDAARSAAATTPASGGSSTTTRRCRRHQHARRA